MKRNPARQDGAAARRAIVINTVQIAALLFFSGALMLLDQGGHPLLKVLMLLGSTLTVVGAVMDIAEAVRTDRRLRTIDSLRDTNEQMDELNLKLRAQRHDFLNHMQVVYSLLEMNEYEEALSYLDRLSDQFRSLSGVLKTRMTAFNALLQAKQTACTQSGITLETRITTQLEHFPLPAWEICTILGNLLDNAMEALSGQKEGRIQLFAEESLEGFIFLIKNNGPAIPPELRSTLFNPGVSTKGEGHGMGLSIVRSTLGEYGGTIELLEGEETAFRVFVPRGDRGEECP